MFMRGEKIPKPSFIIYDARKINGPTVDKPAAPQYF